ncbi:MAG: hypothetical protein Ct9H300mP14_00480 [Gammaproteobacteria bacterium]|nr:MAG: hypothetical protein Ct9H300mP14_00480 [Gammaproteobacteria bacterium]
MASKEEVLTAINNSKVCTINALRRAQHAGRTMGNLVTMGALDTLVDRLTYPPRTGLTATPLRFCLLNTSLRFH